MAANGFAGQVVLTPGVIATVPSNSDPSVIHEVRLSRNGLIYCDCEGYRWRRMCSHIRTLSDQNPGVKLMVRASLLMLRESITEILKELDE
jgi:hypothetical protein